MTDRPPTDPVAPPRLQHHALVILSGAAVLAMVYVGREILVPITLAAILSLLLAPLVRWLKHVGFGQVASVLLAVGGVAVLLAAITGMIVSQVVSMADRLPQYETTLRAKVQVVQDITAGRLAQMQGEAGRVIAQLVEPAPPAASASDAAASAAAAAASADARRPARGRAAAPTPVPDAVHLPLTDSGAVPVEVRTPPQSPVKLVSHLASSIWGPLGTAAIVVVVLVFALLEHESLRDRFIRLTGGGDLRATTQAFNDAGERLSRFFVSQFAVNVGVGAVIAAGLAALGVPQWLLWGVLTALLRFVPYVGVFVAAASAALLAAAADPGWTLVLLTLGLFGFVEVLASQAIEPLLYGHSTGLSPLSVIVAAIFWSWIWGPIGLLLSTPLTLCLVVAGRHVKALAFLDILLGDGPALTLSQRFYQRALSGDADEILADARTYLKRRTLARYCDRILLPALQLAGADFAAGTISPEQQEHVRNVIVAVIESIGPDARRGGRRRRESVLEGTDLGQRLRREREAAFGRWQGPVEAPAGSVALCIGLGTIRDTLVTEVLVRVLRDRGIDARHVALADLASAPPAGAARDAIAMVYVVGAFPSEEWTRTVAVAGDLRRRYPAAALVGMLPDAQLTAAEEASVARGVDLVAHSFEEALEHAALRYPEAAAGKKEKGKGRARVGATPAAAPASLAEPERREAASVRPSA